MTKRRTRRRGGAETAWARGNSKPQRLRVSALIFLSLSRLEGHPLAAAQLAGALLVGLALQAAGGALRGHLRVGAGGPLRRLGRVRAPEEAEGRGQRDSDSQAVPPPPRWPGPPRRPPPRPPASPPRCRGACTR